MFLNENKTFIIAEMSANHGKDINIAKQTIEMAKKCGADAIKLQTFTPDTITIDCDEKYFTINNNTIWDGQKYYDLYKPIYLPWEWHDELINHAKKVGIICFSTPYEKTSVDFLETLNVPIYKIAAFEMLDYDFVKYVASKQKPTIISTGIASLGEIEDVYNIFKKIGNDQLVLLHCISSYPTDPKDCNLITIRNLKETFNVKVGLSDHSMSFAPPVINILMGGTVIEKHFTLNKSINSPDIRFSLDPNEFEAMVKAVRDTEKAIGKITYELTEKKMNSRLIGRSLFVVEDIKKGEIFTEKNIRSIRPGYGMLPKYLNDILGRCALLDLKRGTPLSKEMF